MRIFLFSVLVLIFLSCHSEKEKRQSPNIIYILADDLGYGELGVYGQKHIETPNINELAKSGMTFSQHYSGAPVCAPARCILLTGMHAGHAYIRGNDEWDERGEVWDYKKVFSNSSLEGQRPLADSIVTMAELLQEAGYKTGVFGKWGLGAPDSEGVPNKQGFDSFYGYNCQRQAHNLYPSHLWENDQKVLLNNELVPPKTKLDSLADPYEEKSYAKFYQPDYGPEKIHEKALAFLDKHSSEPFFMYYASPLPHLPLQVPQEHMRKYRDKFGEEEPYIGDDAYFPNQYPKAAYAAMISYLDFQVGELVQKLKEQGIYENTIIMFSSDNGPTYLGGVDYEFFESSKPFSNSYGWTKGFVHEGGIRVPMIVSWPDKIQKGSTSDLTSVFYDVLPTVCDIANIEYPEYIDGISFMPTLLGKSQKQHEFLYWEFPSYKGQQAVRLGVWKGIRKNIFEGNMDVELYNIEKDPEELINVASKFPDIVNQIEQIMIREHQTAENKKFKIKELGDI